MSKNNRWVGVLVGFTALLSLSACGKAAFVTGVTAQSYEQNGDTLAELSLNLDTYGFPLPSLNIPIVDPNDAAVEYGDVAINGSQLTLTVDVTATAHLPSGADSLPNGQPLPISTTGMGVIELPVKNSQARVYIAVGDGNAMIGTAIPIHALDSIAKYLGGVDLFPQFNINNVTGVAGIFTAGGSSGDSGIAVFLDVSNVLPGVLK